MKYTLSDPGVPLSVADPTLLEYLRCYRLPLPPEYRYGSCQFTNKTSKYSVSLFGQTWMPLHPIGLIFFVHGFHEHAGNYSGLITDFLAHNFAVSTMDLRGHGLSDGIHGHADTPYSFVEDYELWIKTTLESVGTSLPKYLWGHSLGGLISLQLMLRNKNKFKFKGAVLTSPFLGFPEVTGTRRLLLGAVPLLARLTPTMGFADPTSDSTVLTTNEAYLAERDVDPLITEHVTPRFVTNMDLAIKEIHREAAKFDKAPATLMMLAGQEMVTNLNDARRFAFHGLANIKHKVIEFPDSRHELEKELNARDRVVKESLAWFRSHN